MWGGVSSDPGGPRAGGWATATEQGTSCRVQSLESTTPLAVSKSFLFHPSGPEVHISHPDSPDSSIRTGTSLLSRIMPSTLQPLRTHALSKAVRASDAYGGPTWARHISSSCHPHNGRPYYYCTHHLLRKQWKQQVKKPNPVATAGKDEAQIWLQEVWAGRFSLSCHVAHLARLSIKPTSVARGPPLQNSPGVYHSLAQAHAESCYTRTLKHHLVINGCSWVVIKKNHSVPCFTAKSRTASIFA